MPNVPTSVLRHYARSRARPSDQSQPPRTLAALTGVRGVAAWWVVLYHFREIIPTPGWSEAYAVIERGDLAVDLFFVLSGFIISMNYLHQLNKFSWQGYLRFLALRLGRIYPLHLFMMLVFLLNPIAIMLFSNAQEPGQRYNPVYFGLSLALIQNWGFATDLAWNVPAWSISTEWFVYLIFPCLVVLSKFATSRVRAAAGIAIPLLLMSVLIRVFGDDITATGLFRCVLEFTAGGSIYLVWVHHDRHQRYWADIAGATGLILIGAVLWLPLPDYPAASVAWCALIYGLANQATILSRIFSNRIIFLVGEYSYSTYLTHYFIRDWIKFVFVGHAVPWYQEMAIYISVTAFASWTLYRLIEVPGRRLVRGLVDRRPVSTPPSVTIG